MKKSYLIGAILLMILGFGLPVNAQQQTQEFDDESADQSQYSTIVTDHFRIHYPEELATITNEVMALSEAAFEKLTKRMQWTPKARIHMVLSNKSDQSNGFATVSPYNYIFLYVAPPLANSSLDHYREYLDLLIQHELTHIIHIDQHRGIVTPFRLLFGRIVHPNAATPSWMREGMAVFEESLIHENFGRNNSDYTDMVLRSSVYENTFPRIDQIAGLSPHFPGGAGPYLFGGRFFEWLGKNYGEDRMYKYQEEYSRTLWLYSLNNKARRVYGKSFYKLWDDFQADQVSKYNGVKEEIESQGVTELETVLANKDDRDSLSLYVPRPGTTGYAFFRSSLDNGPRLFIYPEADQKPIVIKRAVHGQMSFSKDGRYLAFSAFGSAEPKSKHGEVYLYDLKNKKMGRMKDKLHQGKSMHVFDPDWSSQDDGDRWLIMVMQNVDTDQLYAFDAVEKKGYVLTDAPQKTQFSNPRFSPDGSLIVVSRKDPNGQRDIVIYDKTGREIGKVTDDMTVDNHPIFSPDGTKIYFSSFKTGIANIFEYNVNTDRVRQITNVLTGVFQPLPNETGDEIFVEQYGTLGNSIQKFKNDYKTSWHSYVVHPNEDDDVGDPEIKSYTYEEIQTLAGLTLENRYRHVFQKKPSPSGVAFESYAIEDVNKGNLQDFEVVAQNEVLDESVYIKNRHGNRDLDLGLPKHEPEAEVQTEKQPEKKKIEKNKKEKEKKIEKPEKVEPSVYKDLLQDKPRELKLEINHPEGKKKYSPFPQIFVPKYVVPLLVANENTALFGLGTGNFDPLNRHAWMATVNYRTDAGFVGGTFQYIYKRHNPIFFMGAVRYAIDWGVASTDGTHFFEERNQGYAGLSYGIKAHRFSLSYFYEDRGAYTNNIDTSLLLNMQPYAGARFRYTFGQWKNYANSISQENGLLVKLGVDYVDEVLGSHDVNEEIVGTADMRFFLEMPWSEHHVLALRVAGGHKIGDLQQFGVFRLGGAFGEGVGAAQVSSRVFSMRGLPGITFGGDSVFLASGEYRLPLATNVNRGIGTWPVFLDKLSLVLFVDSGDIRYETESADLFSRYMVAPGAEFRGHFVFGYGLPLTLRLGYAKVVMNQDRLGTLTDPILGTEVADSGTVYFQVGTSF